MDINTKKWKQKLSVFLIVSMIMQTAGVTALAEEGSLVEEASKVITATSSNAKRHVQTASDADTATDSDWDEAEEDEVDLIDDLEVELATPFNARAVSGKEVEVSTHTELVNAVKNASAGDTIVLADDIDATSSASLCVTKKIPVNGNGHTLDGHYDCKCEAEFKESQRYLYIWLTVWRWSFSGKLYHYWKQFQ